VDFKAMIICLALHLLLLMFEIFVCINLGGGKVFPWRLMFMPLYVLSSLSIIACIWGFRHDRSVEVCNVQLICSPFELGSISSCCLAKRPDSVERWKLSSPWNLIQTF